MSGSCSRPVLALSRKQHVAARFLIAATAASFISVRYASLPTSASK